MDSQKEYSKLISKLNLLLLENNLDNNIAFELTKVFYKNSTDNYKKGIEQTKEIYNL